MHLVVEHVLDGLIDAESPIAQRVLQDHRTYTFAVKLALVFHMGLLEKPLFDNLAALNGLRNLYAHELDVDLGNAFDRQFVQRNGSPLFPDVGATRQSIGDDPKAGVQVLLQVRDVTFGWLHEVAQQHGISD